MERSLLLGMHFIFVVPAFCIHWFEMNWNSFKIHWESCSTSPGELKLGLNQHYQKSFIKYCIWKEKAYVDTNIIIDTYNISITCFSGVLTRNWYLLSGLSFNTELFQQVQHHKFCLNLVCHLHNRYVFF